MKKMKIYSDHSINPQDVDISAIKIIDRLQSFDFEAYIVGGGVRDLLLKKKPKDFDIATNATPNQIKKIFRNSRIIGRRFKLVHIYFYGGKIIEVATFRAEQPAIENADKTENIYGNIETDSFRRDLTINALFYNPTNNIIVDYVDGFKDLNKRIIRIIGSPTIRYQEDPVRIIRTLRHQARTGFMLEESAQKAIEDQAILLSDCPPMRIYEEFKKDFQSGYFQEIFTLMKDYKILKYFLPNLEKNILKRTVNIQDFMFCIKGLDRLALENKLTSILPGLAILYLFSSEGFNLNDQILTFFPKQSDISPFISENLKTLAISKKEKHDIGLLLKALWSLENAYNKNKKFFVSDENKKADLKILLKLLNLNEQKTYLNKVFKFL